ncbi:hypothetical protein [Oryza sativa Japonica Group]|uniref:Uncharacterized protein n=1 Tax=Oryza sativa subsp. japonica TaxID=39947 RepID=Q5ZCL1_ORYSJ|nr:hypothetical protein [Oryza sativa Japonica Group]
MDLDGRRTKGSSRSSSLVRDAAVAKEEAMLLVVVVVHMNGKALQDEVVYSEVVRRRRPDGSYGQANTMGWVLGLLLASAKRKKTGSPLFMLGGISCASASLHFVIASSVPDDASVLGKYYYQLGYAVAYALYSSRVLHMSLAVVMASLATAAVNVRKYSEVRGHGDRGGRRGVARHDEHARETFLMALATFPWLDLMAWRMDEYLSWIRRRLLRVATSLNGLLRTAASGAAAVIAAAPPVAATLSELVARKLSMDSSISDDVLRCIIRCNSMGTTSSVQRADEKEQNRDQTGIGGFGGGGDLV